ncbi:MAG TPA: RsmD family RNA methyltransferase [Candidatus Saccharimonadales bacterium]
MRVISGALGGRTFYAPKGWRTHPMSEQLRGALFNILGDITGLSLLDAYAGSGAIGIEALSRGAKFVQFVDIDKTAHKIIEQNLELLDLKKRAKATLANVEFWGKRQADNKFDLIVADPPYTEVNLSTIEHLGAHLKPNGLMVLSHPGRESAPTVNGVVVVDNRSYGNAALAFYRLASR